MKKAGKWTLGIVVLLIVALVIAGVVFIQGQSPVDRFLRQLSPSNISSARLTPVQSVYPAKAIVLEEEDINTLIRLLRRERYEKNDDPNFTAWTGGPKPNYDLLIQTKDGAEISICINPMYCICCPDNLKGETLASKSEWKGYPFQKEKSGEHQQVMDFIDDLLSKYYAE